MVERVREHWGLKRTGNVILGRVKSAVQSAVRAGALEWDKSAETGPIVKRFLVSSGASARARCPAAGEEPRAIDRISDSELAAGILAAAESIGGGSAQEIVAQTARLFGYKRVGHIIERRIESVLTQHVLKQGLLQERHGVIVPIE